MPRPDGSRGLVVPNIKAAQRFDFHGFWQAYEEVVRKARAGKLTMDDFSHTTVALTNPGGLGTVHSIPPGLLSATVRSEEHTSELQARGHLVCRLLLQLNNA